MSAKLFHLILAASIVLCTNAIAGDASTTPPAVDEAALSRTVWKGLLYAPPANTASNVVAMLKQDKRQKTGFFLLRTEDPILNTRLIELSGSHKNPAVVLTGRLIPNETNTVLVTDLLELPKERKPERK